MLFPELEAIKAIAGFTDNGDPVAGHTTNEAIQALFGDVVPSKPVSPEQFDAIISRCDNNGWNGWRATWQMWRDQGLLS